MTQQTVYELLKKKGVWMSNKAIANALGIRMTNASNSTKKLSEWGTIERKEVKEKFHNICMFRIK